MKTRTRLKKIESSIDSIFSGKPPGIPALLIFLIYDKICVAESWFYWAFMVIFVISSIMYLISSIINLILEITNRKHGKHKRQ